MPEPAARLNDLPVYFFAVIAQRIQALQAQGIDVVSLDIGSPDLPPPRAVVDALSHSAHEANTHGYSVTGVYLLFAKQWRSTTKIASVSA
jgi:LL-diaminopimelate aminotransferase